MSMKARILRSVLAVTIMGGTLVATSSAASAGYTPTAKVQSGNKVPGGSVTITGSSWKPGATVRLSSACFVTSPVNATVNPVGKFTKPAISLKSSLNRGQTCSVNVCEGPAFTRCKTVTFKIKARTNTCDDDRARQQHQRQRDDCDD
jgi:hypothetical protein